MLNKKKIGLGMLVAGGLVSVAGLVIMNKHNKEDDILEELSMTTEFEPEPENSKTMQYYSFEADKEEISTKAPYKVETPVEFKLTEENTMKVTSTYNPSAEPISMSQEAIEAMATSSF